MKKWKVGDKAHVLTRGWCTLLRKERASADYSPRPMSGEKHQAWLVQWWDGAEGVIGEHHFDKEER